MTASVEEMAVIKGQSLFSRGGCQEQDPERSVPAPVLFNILLQELKEEAGVSAERAQG